VTAQTTPITRVVDARGAVYVVTGGAGAPLYEAGRAYFTVTSASAHHFLVARIRRDRLEVKVYDAGGGVIDGFARTR